MALAAWALPRATLDVDLMLWVTADEFERVCLHLATRYIPRTSDPLPFARQHRVLPVETADGVRLDLLFATYPFERVMIDRVPRRRVGTVEARVASLEDLILLKLPSSRVKDREDIHSILQRYRGDLDWTYLLSRADMLAETLDQPELATFLRSHRPE